jgi:hypothetical protein
VFSFGFVAWRLELEGKAHKSSADPSFAGVEVKALEALESITVLQKEGSETAGLLATTSLVLHNGVGFTDSKVDVGAQYTSVLLGEVVVAM